MVQSYKSAYPAAFRQQIVELVALGKSPKQLSQEFGCHVTTIRDWCRAAGVQYQSNRATATILSSNNALLSVNERQELIELRKKLKSVERESMTYWQKLRPGLQTTSIDWQSISVD